MAETMLQPQSSSAAGAVTIRSYRPTDHRHCRALWAQFTAEHRAMYSDDPAPDTSDPGAAFEEYLTRLDLSGMWVADDNATAVGLVGLILDGRSGGEVEPVVVTAERRGEGIGRALLAHVAEQARKRGLRQLTVSPAVRNANAIHSLHAAGYDTLSRITLAIELNAQNSTVRDAMDVHDLEFQY